MSQSRSVYQPDYRLWRVLLVGILIGGVLGATVGWSATVATVTAEEQGADNSTRSPAAISATLGQAVYLPGLTLQLLQSSRDIVTDELVVSIGYLITPGSRYTGMAGAELFSGSLNRVDTGLPRTVEVNQIDETKGWVTARFQVGCASGLETIQYAARPFGLTPVINFGIVTRSCQ